jgi:hypothetical protein
VAFSWSRSTRVRSYDECRSKSGGSLS